MFMGYFNATLVCLKLSIICLNPLIPCSSLHCIYKPAKYIARLICIFGYFIKINCIISCWLLFVLNINWFWLKNLFQYRFNIFWHIPATQTFAPQYSKPAFRVRPWICGHREKSFWFVNLCCPYCF